MCDPGTLAALSAVSTVVGLGGTAASAIGQMSAAKKQESAVNAWQAKQKNFRDIESQRQEGLRKDADAARVAGLDKLSREQQDAARKTEEERLTNYLTGGAEGEAAGEPPPISVADAELSGQSGGDQNFKTDMAKKINEATTDARQRIARLATVSAYGNSSGGLGRTNQNALLESGRAIDRANNARQGSLAAFGTEKNIRPVEMSYSAPFADAFSTALQAGSAGLGSAYSDGLFSKRTAAKVPSSAGLSASSPWTGLF